MTLRNVLLTGASSPLGEELALRLLDDSRVGHVFAVTSPDEPLTISDNERLSEFSLDLRRQRRLHDLLFGPARQRGINTLVHTAQVASATAEGAAVHAQNVDALRAILEFAERHPTIKRVIIRSAAEVYQVQRDLPSLIAEDHPLNMNSGAPQWVRDRVEADVTACTRMGLGPIQIQVLRMAEVLAPGCGSQFYDYLQSPFCFTPFGYDPMLNFLSVADAATALHRAIHSSHQGVFNIPGADSLPLSMAIYRWGRLSIPAPETIINAVYRFRRRFRGGQFRYGMNRRRFHYSGILDGTRASEILQYIPNHPIDWPLKDVVDPEA